MKELAHAILMNAHAFEWSLQGMGMLRLHLPNDCRLHVWDSRFRVPNVSMVHDHLQWGLHSTIVAGRLTNHRYIVGDGEPHLYATLKPGYGCFFKHDPKPVGLVALEPDLYVAGQSYSQQPNEIHRTEAEDGTVTFMRKTPTNDESARVFWPAGEQWVSAEPRRATADEVATITGRALRRWFIPQGTTDRSAGLLEEAAQRMEELERENQRLQAESTKHLRTAITYSDIISNHCIAMQAAVVEMHIGKGAEAAMTWIENTLRGPGLQPDIDAAEGMGGAQAWFDAKTAEHEAFRAKHQGGSHG